MSSEANRHFLNTEFDEDSIHPEVLHAVKALRDNGIETTASHSGVGQIGSDHSWGSYIQILFTTKDGFKIAKRIKEVTKEITVKLQQNLGNSAIALQLVSAKEWYSNPYTTSMKTDIPIYRLQLIGQTTDNEIRQAWKTVAEEFSHLKFPRQTFTI